MKSENSRMNSTGVNSNAMNGNTMNSNTVTQNTETTAAAAAAPTSATTAPKQLYTTETTIGKVTYVVSVCRSPNAIGTLKERMRSVILQTAENNRMREMQARRESEMRERHEQ